MIRRTRRCQHCGDRFTVRDGRREWFGRRRVYCSESCRDIAVEAFTHPANVGDMP